MPKADLSGHSAGGLEDKSAKRNVDSGGSARVHRAIRTLSGTGLGQFAGCLGKDRDILCCPENLSDGPISLAEGISSQESIQAVARLLFVPIQVRNCTT